MLSIHFAYHIGTASLESLIEKVDLIPPAAMGTTLLFRVKEVLPALEHTVRDGGSRNTTSWLSNDVRKTGVQRSNLQQARKSVKQSCRATGLEDNLVGEHKHARFGKQIGIYMLGFDDGQHLAVDQIQHFLPGLSRYSLEAIGRSTSRKVSSRGTEPYL
jgi:hypothetical protein